MLASGKQHIDDDRWNQMCRRVQRVEIFHLLIVAFLIFHHPKSSLDNSNLRETSRVKVKNYVEYDPRSNPYRKLNIKNKEKNPDQVLDLIDPVQAIKTSDATEDKLEIKFSKERRKRVSKKKPFIKSDSKNVLPKRKRKSETSSRSIQRDKKRITKSNYRNKIFDKGMHHRNLQAEDASGNCVGILFHFEINLDQYADETYWELATENPDNVFLTKKYTLDSSFTTVTYEKCLNEGRYFFTLYDSWSDGIDCGKESCFKIRLNNILIYSDIPFRGNKITQVFDSTDKCALGYTFEVEDSRGHAIPDNSWSLSQIIHDDINEAVELIRDTEKSNETVFSACVRVGTYLLQGNDINCGNCYNIFINGELVKHGKNFVGTDSHKIIVSPLGKGYEQHCDKVPLISPSNAVNNFVYDEVIERKLEAIYSLTSIETISHDPTSAQYKAACWIIFDDKVAFENEQNSIGAVATDDDFIQRYILAVFLFATEQNIEKLHVRTCDFASKRVICNEEERITELNFQQSTSMGFIPSELHRLLNLEMLNLSENNLRGTIPNQLSRLNLLNYLNLDDNKIHGPIPPEFGNLIRLEWLSMRENKITGTIPKSLGQCTELEQLLLNDNLLQGSIAPEIFLDYKKLKNINIARNFMNGTIPPNIQNCQNLEKINLEQNSFESKIPKEFWELSNLRWINFDENKLTGTIDSNIGNLRQLKWINIDHNLLTGELPDVFTNLTKLKTLDFSSNQFQGQIPLTLWQTSMEQIILDDNDLSGIVPDDSCSAEKFILVDDSRWFEDNPKVNCGCCKNEECFIWDIDQDDEHIYCPSQNIHAFDYIKFYEITDNIAQEKIVVDVGSERRKAKFCLSPTGCYNTNLQQSVKEDPLLFENPKPDTFKNISIGTCDALNVCGKVIGEYHARRADLNHLTQLAAPNVSKLEEKDSATNKAVCDVITRDMKYEKYSICDGTLLQRYVLLYFYYSQKLDFDFLNLANKDTCEWPGVSCDMNGKFIKRLNLAEQNLQGSIITEIGLLKSLEEIDLSNNALIGTIDSALYKNLPNLQVFRLGTNKFSGLFPEGLVELEQLKECNISGNLFVGSLPQDFVYSKELEIFDIHNNLFHDKFPVSLLESTELKVIDLSRNNFEDNIPSGIGHLKNLTILRLSENNFVGSIPFQMFNAAGIKELMLQSNQITGTIPTEIVFMRDIEHIYISHNSLRGTIPAELGDLESLVHLHLHRNLLQGSAPSLMVSDTTKLDIFGYITDCGFPTYHLPEDLECEGCTMCCNSEKKCQVTKPNILSKVELFTTATVFPLGCILIYMLCAKKEGNRYFKLFVDDRDPLSIYSDGSVYSFIFSNDSVAFNIYGATVVIQILILTLYLQASDFIDDSDYIYSFQCLGNSIECVQERSSRVHGPILFVVITFLFLGHDFVMATLQIRKSAYLLDKRLFISGFIFFFITAYTFLVSFRYNTALLETNTDMIANTMILLFVNELDEKMLNLMVAVAPEWTETILEQVQHNMQEKTT